VATDIAARGLDIDDLSTSSTSTAQYSGDLYHRIGRTGRAGNSGIAISLCDFEEKKLLADIEKLCGRGIP